MTTGLENLILKHYQAEKINGEIVITEAKNGYSANIQY